MSEADPRYLPGFVRVEVETEIEGEMRTPKGTGYLVRPGLVLTAGHLLEGSVKSCRVVPQTGKPLGAREVWKCFEAHGVDAALLQLDETADEERAPTRLARSPLQHDEDWWSYGYPETATRDVPLPALRGEALLAPEGKARFEVTVKDTKKDAKSWKGISGAPVFVGRAVYGVIGLALEVDEGRRFHATGVHRLFEDPDFRKHFEDEEDWEARREELVEELESVLRDHDLAIDKLIEAARSTRPNRQAPAPEWGRIERGTGEARAVAEAICDTEIGPVLILCNSAYHVLRKAARETADRERRAHWLEASEAVHRLVAKVAPFLTAFKVGLKLPEGQGGLFQLPCRVPTVFEMLMARVERREPRWRVLADAREYPRGEAEVRVPQFETGGVAGQELWAFARILAGKVFHPNDFPSAFNREIRPEGRELDRAMGRLNLELEGIAGREREPFRYYLILDEIPTSWGVERLAEDLELHLPAIWLLQSNGGDALEEVRWCQPLRELLFTRQRVFERQRPEKDTP